MELRHSSRYRLLRFLYTVFLYLLLPLVLIRLAWRGRRIPGDWYRIPERFGWFTHIGVRPVIWIHAVSVGEVQAAEPMVRALLDAYPDWRLLLTTTTPTGSERVQKLFGDRLAHVYAPYDLPGAVRRFLDRTDPALVLIMETELWPNLFHVCGTRAIPIMLVNARVSPGSMRGYQRFRSLARAMLSSVAAVAAQSDADADRLVELGVDPGRLRVTGNLKHEQRFDPGLDSKAAEMRVSWGIRRKVWIAASTHAGEEEMVLHAHGLICVQEPDCLLLLVPRHPERSQQVAGLCARQRYQAVLHSDRTISRRDADIFIGDTLGQLPLYYLAADVAFVGGSLVPSGGHNLLEPAALGRPVIIGPHVENFSDSVRELRVAGACRLAGDAGELSRLVVQWLQDAEAGRKAGKRGREVVEKNRGALRMVMGMIKQALM